MRGRWSRIANPTIGLPRAGVFWNVERGRALEKLSEKENLSAEKLEKVIGDYLFTEKKPLRDEVISMMKTRPALKDRAPASERITTKILYFVETFISGIAG